MGKWSSPRLGTDNPTGCGWGRGALSFLILNAPRAQLSGKLGHLFGLRRVNLSNVSTRQCVGASFTHNQDLGLVLRLFPHGGKGGCQPPERHIPCAFRVLFKKPLPTPGSQRWSPVFPSRSFVVVAFTSKGCEVPQIYLCV